MKMGQSRQDQRRDLSRGLRLSSSIMATPDHDDDDDSGRENCCLASSPLFSLLEEDETTTTKHTTAVLGNKTNSRVGADDSVVVSTTAVVTPTHQTKTKTKAIATGINITPPSTPPKERTLQNIPDTANNTHAQQGNNDNNSNDNEMWKVKVEQTKEKLSEAATITTHTAAAATAAETMDTSVKNDGTNSTGPKETARTNGRVNNHNNNKNDYKLVAEAVGDILVERILHTDPTLLDTVPVEEWEVLLALPVPVMVDLLQQLDSNDNDNDAGENVVFGWNNVQSFVDEYQKKNNQKTPVVV